MKKAWIALTALLWTLHLAFGADAESRLPKEPKLASERPLYFRALLGKEGKASMLGVLDESGGTGTGYNIAYVDENMDNDLTNDTPKKFPVADVPASSSSGRVATGPEPRFDFKGPLREKETAEYTLNIYALRNTTPVTNPQDKYYFFWYLRTEQWNYFFINGQMSLYSKAADALKGAPVRLGGTCKWEITGGIREKDALVSAGLKDENGCTLRIVNGETENPSPELTLIKNGKTLAQEKMSFG
ncbi:MAG: hypothetical protein Q8Q12_04500 [bacterium]|nr:hypothetical protein [bacterium]